MERKPKTNNVLNVRLAAFALWYTTVERPRLRRPLIVNGLIFLFIARLANLVRRRRQLSVGWYPASEGDLIWQDVWDGWQDMIEQGLMQ